MGTPVAPLQPGQPQAGYIPQKHGNWAQWVAPAITLIIGIVTVSLMVHFRNVDSTTRTSDEHANGLIDAKLTPAINSINQNIETKLAPITQQLKDLSEKLWKLEGRFEQLDADQKRLTKIQLNKLSEQLALAKESHRPINVATLISLGESVAGFSNSADQGISQLAWRTRLQIIDYRSFLNTAVAPNPGNRKLIDPEHDGREDFFVEFKARRLPGFQTGKFGYVGFGKVLPVGSPEGSLFLEIGHEGKANATTQHFFVEAAGFGLKLDGFHIRNTVIKGAMISYDGGPLILENVYFVDCTFAMPLTPPGQNLADAVLSHVPATFSRS